MKEIDEKIKTLCALAPSAPARNALNKFLKKKNLKTIEPKILTKFVTKALNLYENNDRKGYDKLINDILRHVGAHQIAHDVAKEFSRFCTTCLENRRSLPRKIKTHMPEHEALNKILKEKNLKTIEPKIVSNLVTKALNLFVKKDGKGYDNLVNEVLLLAGVNLMAYDVAKEFSRFCNTCFDDMGYTSRLEKLPWKAPWK